MSAPCQQNSLCPCLMCKAIALSNTLRAVRAEAEARTKAEAERKAKSTAMAVRLALVAKAVQMTSLTQEALIKRAEHLQRKITGQSAPVEYAVLFPLGKPTPGTGLVSKADPYRIENGQPTVSAAAEAEARRKAEAERIAATLPEWEAEPIASSGVSQRRRKFSPKPLEFAPEKWGGREDNRPLWQIIAERQGK